MHPTGHIHYNIILVLRRRPLLLLLANLGFIATSPGTIDPKPYTRTYARCSSRKRSHKVCRGACTEGCRKLLGGAIVQFLLAGSGSQRAEKAVLSCGKGKNLTAAVRAVCAGSGPTSASVRANLPCNLPVKGPSSPNDEARNRALALSPLPIREPRPLRFATWGDA